MLEMGENRLRDEGFTDALGCGQKHRLAEVVEKSASVLDFTDESFNDTLVAPEREPFHFALEFALVWFRSGRDIIIQSQ